MPDVPGPSPALLRLASAGAALGIVLGVRAGLAEEARAQGAYLLVTTLGYGHLLGASLPRADAAPRPFLDRALTGGLAATSLAVILALYSGLLATSPWLVWPMLLASLWHIVENDVALGRTGALGRLPFATTLAGHLAAVAAAALLGAVALGVATRSTGGVAFWEVFALATGFHLIEWLLVIGARVCELAQRGGTREARALARRTLLVHLPAVPVCALAFRGGDAFAWLRGAFEPPTYLLFSLLHVAHTVARRRGAPPGA